MRTYCLIIISAAFLCVSCAAYVGPHGAGVAIGPHPVYTEPVGSYYAYRGHPYYYDNSQSRSGYGGYSNEYYQRDARYRKDWKDRRKDNWKYYRD